MPPETKKLRKWTAPQWEQSIQTYRLGSDIVQKIKLFSEANLEGLSSDSDATWTAILNNFSKELKYACIENVSALRESWMNQVLFSSPVRSNLGGKDIPNAELEILAHECMIWDMYVTVSKNPKRISDLAAIWNNESDERLRQREFVRLCFQWTYEESKGANQLVGYEPNYTSTTMEKFCQFYSSFSDTFMKHSTSEEQAVTLEVWPTISLACDPTTYAKILKGIHFTVKYGGLYHHLHQSAVTLISRLIRLYGGALALESEDVVEEVEIWVSGIPQDGIHKCSLSYLIQALLECKFSMEPNDHGDNGKCIVSKYEDLIWVHKYPPTFPKTKGNYESSHLTQEPEPTGALQKTTVATEIEDNSHVLASISNPCIGGSQQMMHKMRKAYEKKHIGNATCESLELYFLLELMFTVRKYPDRRQLVESIWCQNNCLFERYTHFNAISTTWAKMNPDAPKIPAYTFEKFCNLQLNQMECASNRIPIPFNFQEDPDFSQWYEKVIKRYLVADIYNKHPMLEQLESYQKVLLMQQLQADEKIWFEYQTVFWAQKSDNESKSPPHHHFPQKTFCNSFNVLVPGQNSQLLYLFAKHFEYLIFLHGGDAKVVHKGELALGSYSIVLGDMAQRWMNEIGPLVFTSSFINDCIIAGKCEPRLSLLYAYDSTRRIPNEIIDRECIIMSACIEVANEVETIHELYQKLLKNKKVLEHVQDKDDFKQEIRRKFLVYNTFRSFEPVWNTFKLLNHAVVHFGDVKCVFPLLRLFNDKNVNG